MNILDIPALICHWDFMGPDPFTSKGPNQYTLLEGNGNIVFNSIKDTGKQAITISEGQYLYIKREDCPALNINGIDAQVTILAFIKRQSKSYVQCEAIAGMWNETEKLRQYCLFLNLRLHDSADQVCGHISGVGGPTPGQKWCIDASIGKQPVNYNEWNFVAFSYDGAMIKSYLNGKLDSRTDTNPYPYQQGIFNSGSNGSDFTVGAVHRLGEMGNNFVGEIAHLAVFNRALSADDIASFSVI